MDITVVGAHRFAATPERATLSLSAGFESEAKEEAMQMTTRLVTDLHGELQALTATKPSPITWFAVMPIQTRSWRPYHDKGKILPTRYGAAASLSVKFRDFKALMYLASDLGGRPGVTLNGVVWTLTEVTKAKVEAKVLAGAVKRAHERASVMATAAGASSIVAVEIADPGLLRDVVSTGESGYHGVVTRATGAGSEGIQLVPEDIEVSATVHVRFQTAG